MKIASAEAIPVSVPIEKDYETSLARADDRADHVLLRVETADGVTGWGEVSPEPYWPRGMTQSSCYQILKEDVVPQLPGRDCLHIDKVIADLERSIAALPFPMLAVDVALHDAVGKTLERPVYSLLGGPTDDDLVVRSHYSIGIKGPDETAAEAASAAENGYRDFKVKVGGDDPEREIAAIAALHDRVPDARVRIDANQGWAADEAVRYLRRFDEAAGGLEYVEQPVAYDDIEGLRRVREHAPPLVMADESCFSPRDAARLAREDAVDIVNIKLGKAGGIHNGSKIATVAEAHGITCFVGSMGETEIGTAARTHFGLGTRQVTYPCGSSFDYGDLISNAEDWEWGPGSARQAVPSKPGLGVDVDEDRVERYRID